MAKHEKTAARLPRVTVRVAAVATAAALVVMPTSGVLLPRLAGAEEGALAASSSWVRAEQGEAYDAQAVLEAVRGYDIAGADALERYLAGEALTSDELLSIDSDTLLLVNLTLAHEIIDLQEAARAQDTLGAGSGEADSSGSSEDLPASDENEQAGAGDEGVLAPGDDGDAAGDPADAPDASDPEDGTGEPADAEGDAGTGSDSDADSDAEGTLTPGESEDADATDGEVEDANAVADAGKEADADADAAADANANAEAAANAASAPAPVVGTGSADPATFTEPSQAYPAWTYEGDATYTPHNINVSLTTEKFIAVIGEQAREIAQENDLYASVMIAQAILESGSGNSVLARTPNNNLFGIKGSYEGNSISMGTSEDTGNGEYIYIRANFRVYPSARESLLDYADVLANGLGGYYAPAWKSNAETYVEACDYLEGRYATDTSYSEKLQDLIAAYDLTRYDEALDYELVYEYNVPVYDEETGEAVVDPETGEAVTEQRDLLDLVSEATSHLGEDYVWGGSTPGSFDCSGLVQYSYRTALGVSLPRTTFFQCLQGEDVDFDDLHMGDLLFFAENGIADHVAIYLGEGCYIQAPQTGDVVKVTSMSEYMPTFAKRVLPTQSVVPVVEEPAVDVDVAQEAAYQARVAAASIAVRVADILAHLSVPSL